MLSEGGSKNMNSKIIAKKIRELSLRMVHRAKASHIGSALSIADVLAVLAADERICNLSTSEKHQNDRLILSKGHACVALYSTLCIKGFFEESSLMTYGEDYSAYMNHASHYVPGIDVSTGALGHALPIACGRAKAAKLKGEKWHTFVIMSDGELQEGSNWEALMFAAYHRLDNLSIIIDYNNLQSLDSVDNTLSLQPLDKKLESFGWITHTIDGHNHDEIKRGLKKTKEGKTTSALIMKTIKGKGVSFMEDSIHWHYKSPNEEELQKALREL